MNNNAKLKIFELSISGVILGVLLTEFFKIKESIGTVNSLHQRIEHVEEMCLEARK